ncbi:MAG: hypothetical protein SFW36_04965 [Leptolyngbyaceae cyanobacterium bins.59]|nr:hypothetical protein [Leptolyngbyaceae cyanobacterium bins.59]
MSALINSIDPQTVLVVAAITVVFLGLRVLFKLLALESGTIVAIVAIILLLKYGFHISPQQLWFEIGHLPQEISRLVSALG